MSLGTPSRRYVLHHKEVVAPTPLGAGIVSARRLAQIGQNNQIDDGRVLLRPAPPGLCGSIAPLIRGTDQQLSTGLHGTGCFTLIEEEVF